jgi:phosphatidylglycerophosphate synthase
MNTLAQNTRWQQFVTEMRSTYKSMDTEEKWDIWVVRPIGFVEASICRRLHIHPNAITIVSILFGAASGYFFFPGNAEMVLVGTLLLFFANTLDSADGQLARMTKQYTMLGRVLDGFAGDVWFFFIYLFLMLRMAAMPIPFTTEEWGWLSFVLVAVCGLICHSTQCTMADYYRNIHLHFLAGRDYTELVRSSDLKARRMAIASWSGWFEWIWLYFYGGYTRKQVETRRGGLVLHPFDFAYLGLGKAYGFGGAAHRCSIGHLDRHHHIALILGGEKTIGQRPKH